MQKAASNCPTPEAITNGDTLTKGPQIAEAHGISNGTVKSHLRNPSQKTGTKHQTDRVKLVAGFSRPMIA